MFVAKLGKCSSVKWNKKLSKHKRSITVCTHPELFSIIFIQPIHTACLLKLFPPIVDLESNKSLSSSRLFCMPFPKLDWHSFADGLQSKQPSACLPNPLVVKNKLIRLAAFRTGMTTTWRGTSPSTATSRASAFTRSGSGSQTCSCTIGRFDTQARTWLKQILLKEKKNK